MIVCHCEVVSDRRICAEIDRGACSTDDVGDRCGAGARCGSCRPTIATLLAMAVAEPARPAA